MTKHTHAPNRFTILQDGNKISSQSNTKHISMQKSQKALYLKGEHAALVVYHNAKRMQPKRIKRFRLESNTSYLIG